MKENKDPNSTPRKARDRSDRAPNEAAPTGGREEESDVFEIGSLVPWSTDVQMGFPG